MSWITPSTWVAGSKLLASQLNEQVRDNLSALWVYTTKGDLAAAGSDTTLQRIPVGSDGLVLTADSAEDAGMAWKYPAAGGCCACLSTETAQSVSAGVWTSLEFSDVEFDTNGMADLETAADRLVIPANMGGYYAVYGYLKYTASGVTSVGVRDMRIAVNDELTEMFGCTFQDVVDNTYVRLNASNIIYLAEGDYVVLQAFHGYSPSIDVDAARLSIQLVGLA